MLSPVEIVVAISLVIGDLLVLRAYLRPKEHGGGKAYPKRSFKLHVLGGLGALLLGGLALLAHWGEWGTAASVLSVGQGLVVALFAGLFALPMARHTSGYPGFNLVGYVLYTVAWIASALVLIAAPSVDASYACFVLTHAYLTCRVMVWLGEEGWKWLRGSEPAPEPTYSIATTIAAAITLVLAWGWFGLAWHLGSITLAMALQRAGVSVRWHASHQTPRGARVEHPA